MVVLSVHREIYVLINITMVLSTHIVIIYFYYGLLRMCIAFHALGAMTVVLSTLYALYALEAKDREHDCCLLLLVVCRAYGGLVSYCY